jgi:hypothetical protein
MGKALVRTALRGRMRKGVPRVRPIIKTVAKKGYTKSSYSLMFLKYAA